MKKLIFILVIVLAFSFVQKRPSVAINDFKQSIGEWKGSITYLDYSSGKPFTMPANTIVALDSMGSNVILKIDYPKEPKANGNDTFQLTKAGTYFDNQPITKIDRNKEGILFSTTQLNAVDGNDSKKCSIKHSYTFYKNSLVLKKEVLFDGETNWIKRNEFSFSR